MGFRKPGHALGTGPGATAGSLLGGFSVSAVVDGAAVGRRAPPTYYIFFLFFSGL